MKKALFTFLKIGFALAIVAYLVWDAQKNNAFGTLREQSKNWWLLGAAWIACASAVLLTLIRWYYLVRALDLPFSIREALRIGFWGYLFNLAPLGIVGGDALKAVMLAHRRPGRRAEAVATVFVDRAIGLFMLFVVASVGILMTRFWEFGGVEVRVMCKATLLVTLIGALVIFALLMPDLSGGRVTRLLARTPRAGPVLQRLAEAVKLYRRRRHVLLAAAVMSAAVHSLFTLGIFLIAGGLYDAVPSLGLHFVLSPLSAVTGVIPLPMGPFEAVLNYLYTVVPVAGGDLIESGRGLVIALTYRIITVLIAAIGICYYLGSRTEVAEVLHEAEEEAEQQPDGQPLHAGAE